MSTVDDNLVVPAIFNTYDIQESIRYFLRLNKLTIDDIDFFITKTVTQIIDKSESGSPMVLESEGLTSIDDKYMLNSTFGIKQLHILKIVTKENDNNRFKLTISADKDLSAVKVTLAKDSFIVKNKWIEHRLYQEIQKLLAFHGVILYHFEDDLRNQIFSFLREAPDGIQPNDTVFIAAKAYKFKKPIPDSIDYIYREAKENEAAPRINSDDLYDQHYVKEAKTGDILVEYIKAVDSTPGRNCKGVYIESILAPIRNAPSFTHDEISVRKFETSEKIVYQALKDGFVNITKNTLLIDNSINIRKIGAKETGTIRSKEAKEAKLNVLESNPVLDAIGPSMSVSVAKLRVNGSVANDAKLHAKEVEILGVTHSTSYITASESIKIKNHKGAAEAPNIKIQSLEGGVVNGDEVYISVAHSGTIRARVVIIKKLCTNCNIVASESITIDEIEGDENNLYINPAATFHNEIKINDSRKKVQTLILGIRKLQDSVDSLTEIINLNKGNVSKIASSKNANKPEIHKTIVSRFKETLAKLKLQQEELETKKNLRKHYSTILEKALGSVFDARISVKNSFSAKQTIRFRATNEKDYFYTFKKVPFVLKLIKTPEDKFEVVEE
ncbi:MAG: hypothetical protein RL154_178 [Pseudomonadota bacterium]